MRAGKCFFVGGRGGTGHPQILFFGGGGGWGGVGRGVHFQN